MPPYKKFPKLDKRLKVDVVILGGGIVGITAAKLLKEAGHAVAIIKEDRIVKGVTLRTTAKISMGPSLIYNKLILILGQSKAQEFANSSIKAVEKVADIIRKQRIDCEFHRLPLYIYNESDEKVDELKSEFEATKKLGLPVPYTEKAPLSFKTGPAIKYENQPQFHSRKHLLALSEDIVGESSYIFERTSAIIVKYVKINGVFADKGS